MAQAAVRLSWYGLATSEPAGVNAETGIALDRSDAQVGAEPLPIPTSAPSTVYSAVKQIALQVTTGAPTTLSNATVRASATMPSGVAWFYQANGSYVSQLASVGHSTSGVTAGAAAIASDTSYAINDRVQIDVGATSELRMVIGVSGSGPYTLTLDRGLTSSHSSGVQIARFTSAAPADALAEAASNQPAVPTGYIAPTTSAVQYDAMGVSAATTGRKSNFLRVIAGLSTAFGISPGTVSMPSLIVSYDEM